MTARDLGCDWLVFPVLLDLNPTQRWSPPTDLSHTRYRTETILSIPYCACIPRLEVLREGLLRSCFIEEETWGWEFKSWAESPRIKCHQPTACSSRPAGRQSSGVTSAFILSSVSCRGQTLEYMRMSMENRRLETTGLFKPHAFTTTFLKYLFNFLSNAYTLSPFVKKKKI